LHIEILKKFVKFYKYNVKTFEINKFNYNLILIINIDFQNKKDNKIANKTNFVKLEIRLIETYI
jgi:hypothetical protein